MDKGDGISQLSPVRLNSKNYLQWSVRTLSILQAQELDNVIKEEPPQDEAARRTFAKNDARARSILLCLLDDVQINNVLSCTSSKSVWDVLEAKYKGNTRKECLSLKAELSRIRLQSGEDWRSYIQRAEKMLQEIKMLGGDVENDDFIITITKGLAHRYQLVSAQMDIIESPTIADLCRLLKQHHERIGYQDRSENARAYQANQMGDRGSRFGATGSQWTQWRQRGPEKNRSCSICRRSNHTQASCWFKEKYQQKQKSQKLQKRKNDGRQPRAKIAAESGETVNAKTKEKTFIAKSNSAEMNSEMMIIDSGASSHMCNDPKMLNCLSNVNKEIILANNNTINAEGIGSMEITDVNKSSMELQQVLYVPELINNLISVTKLVDDKKIVIFDEAGCHIQNLKGEEIIMAERKDEFYVINPMNVQEKIEIINTAKENTYELWHKRLGHINYQYLAEMNKNNAVYQFDPQGKVNEDPCEICIETKLKRKPFKRIRGQQSKDVLELLHLDLVGPLKSLSIGNAQYIFMLVDDYSKFMYPKYITEKSETAETLMNAIAYLENQTRKKVKRIRSDCGKEYINHVLKEYCNKKGILHERTVGFSPQSNGKAEASNRIMIEGIRALLADSGLPQKFWAECGNCFAHVRNRTPNKGNFDKTPIEILTKRKPTVGHCRVFGCQCYYVVPKVKRDGKLDKTAKIGIFVGYSVDKKSYRIVDPQTYDLIESRDVKFLENKRGKDLLKTDKDTSINNYILYDYDAEYETVQNPDEDDDHPPPPTPPTTSDIQDAEERTSSEQEQSHSETESPPPRPRRTRSQINCLEDELSDDEERISRTERDAPYRPGDSILTVKEEASRQKRMPNNALIPGGAVATTPTSYEQAMTSPDSLLWKRAIEDELQSLLQHRVWSLEYMPSEHRALNAIWIFKKKINPQTGETRFRARLVADGSKQRYGIDYREVFTPVLKGESFRLLMYLSVQNNYVINHYDIKTAYLNAEIQETLYMHPPKGLVIEEKDRGMKCRLLKSLYGLKQSAKKWGEKLKEVLEQNGYTAFITDPCLYEKCDKQSRSLIAVYVDDLLILSSDENTRKQTVEMLQNNFQIRDVTSENNFLGIELTREKDCIKLTQKFYIEEILNRFDLINCKTVSTPLETNIKLHEHYGSTPVNRTKYQEMLGALMYLSTNTRPDIAYSVMALSRHSVDPKQLHLSALTRIFRYLKRTKDQGLIYVKSAVNQNNNNLLAYVDASWRDGRGDNDRSVTGYAFILNNNLITWYSRLQVNVALSTCEAELQALLTCVKKAIYLKVMIQELTAEILTPNIFVDNAAVIFIANNGTVKERTHHLVRAVHFVHEKLITNEITVEFVESNRNYSDFLTKSLSNLSHNNCMKGLRLFIPKK